MLKGLALTPPTIGRIAIGKVVERNGKRLPEKDDEFTLTSQVQHKNGWVLHPLDRVLRSGLTSSTTSTNRASKAVKGKGEDVTEPTETTPHSPKLRAIPVRLLFDDPDLNLRANYSFFDRSNGRPLCVGNGETCKRATTSGVQTLPCPSPAACELAVGGNCKPYGRLNVRVVPDASCSQAGDADGSLTHGQNQIQNQHQEAHGDELGSFVFRTTGFNSIRTLAARLRYFQAVSGGHLSTLPLELKLRGKSTTLSHRAPIYYVDLVIRSGLTLGQAVQQAKGEADMLIATGFDQAALDEAARLGFACGAFEESEEEGAAVVEEFYPDSHAGDSEEEDGNPAQAGNSGEIEEQRVNGSGRGAHNPKRNLGHKLGERLKAQTGAPFEALRLSSHSAPLKEGNRGTG